MKTCQMKKIDENTKNKLQKQPLILRKYLPKMGYDPEKMKKSLVHDFSIKDQ